jgi:hypothetical protein
MEKAIVILRAIQLKMLGGAVRTARLAVTEATGWYKTKLIWRVVTEGNMQVDGHRLVMMVNGRVDKSGQYFK